MSWGGPVTLNESATAQSQTSDGKSTAVSCINPSSYTVMILHLLTILVPLMLGLIRAR
jgi:hypothetical protein